MGRALILAALLAAGGCQYLAPDPMYRQGAPLPSSRLPAKVRVYSQCEGSGESRVCRKYDHRGQRRYDCERAWSDCNE